MKLSTQPIAQQDMVLTKAILKLADSYGLTGKDLCDILGMSEASASRMHQGKKWLSPSSKEGELALLLIRVYKGLNALIGHSHSKAVAWLRNDNRYFNSKPLEHLKTVSGLVDVVHYLDAMRGKV